jgi:hypothetical protein
LSLRPRMSSSEPNCVESVRTVTGVTQSRWRRDLRENREGEDSDNFDCNQCCHTLILENLLQARVLDLQFGSRGWVVAAKGLEVIDRGLQFFENLGQNGVYFFLSIRAPTGVADCNACKGINTLFLLDRIVTSTDSSSSSSSSTLAAHSSSFEKSKRGGRPPV